MWFWWKKKAKVVRDEETEEREKFEKAAKTKIRVETVRREHGQEIQAYIRANRKLEIQYCLDLGYDRGEPSPEDLARWKKEREEREAAEERGRIHFRLLVLQKMEDLGLDSQMLFERSGIDRKLFSKLKTNPDYRANKETVIRYCLGFHLTQEETDDWMKSAGYWLSDTDDFDLAIRYCIDRKLYSPIDVNILLEAMKVRLLR